MIVSIIVAMDELGGIGKNNRLPWHLPDDLRRFKQLTMGHFLVLGRKTFESLPKQLSGRKIIVVSTVLKSLNAGMGEKDISLLMIGQSPSPVLYAGSITEAIQLAEDHGENELFVGGGAEVYKAVLPMAQRIYLTRVRARVEADVFFPDWDTAEWEVVFTENHESDERHLYSFEFQILEKRSG